MSKKNKIIGGFAVLAFIVLMTYLFFPTDDISASEKEKEKQISFLEADPRWADSLMATMSIEEKAAMLLIYHPENISADSLILDGISPGGFIFNLPQLAKYSGKNVKSHQLVFSDLKNIPVAPFKTGSKKTNVPLPVFANEESFFSVTDDSLRNESKNILLKSADHYHIDGVFFPSVGYNAGKNAERIFRNDTAFYVNEIVSFQSELNKSNFLTGSAMINSIDENKERDSASVSIENYSKSKFPIFFIDSSMKKKSLKENAITRYLKSEYKFSGLIISHLSENNLSDPEHIEKLILSGADMIVTRDFNKTYGKLISLVNFKKIKESDINNKVKKILLAKTWCKARKKKLSYQPTEKFSPYENSFPRRFCKKSFVLLRNDKKHLPIQNVTDNRITVVHFGHRPAEFTSNLYHYLPKKQIIPTRFYEEESKFSSFNSSDVRKFQTVIITVYADLKNQKNLIEKWKQLSSSVKLIILNFKNPDNLPLLSDFSTLIQIWDNSSVDYVYSAQALFGGAEFSARQPFQFDKKYKLQKSNKLAQSRLQYTIPEDIGISSDSLLKIDYIVEEGIRNKAFPGAQVFFSINGMVFYNKSFGTHTYTEKQEVKTDDLFDMASVTKVVASTIVAMSLYEKGLYSLKDSLWKHLPDTLKKHLRMPSTLRNITFQQILIHKTGLAAGQPIIRYIRYRDSLDTKTGRFDRYYCDEPDEYYCVKVGDKFFMEREQLDTIWYAMNRMDVEENPQYRYSDANMNLLYKMLDSKIKNRWRFYLDSLFYKPMGMFNSCYLPIDNEIEPERIVPTENDRYWRKQLLRGYVHDPTAALFGGVAGNAGLFSTAEDIGILFQMLLFGGNYGGKNYFKKETVDLFTSQQPGSHRGLGFNRQVKGNTYGCSPYASNDTFGHTGFTGISVWADKSIKLIYVSCTNRVHPDGENKKIIQLGTTKRIHNVVYEQLKYVMPDKISLEY